MPGWLRKPLRKPECPGGLVDTPHPLPWPSSSGPALTPGGLLVPTPRGPDNPTWTGRQALPGPRPCGDFQLPQLDRAGLESPDCLACTHRAILCWPCSRLPHVPPGETRGVGAFLCQPVCQAHMLQPRRSTEVAQARGVLRRSLLWSPGLLQGASSPGSV